MVQEVTIERSESTVRGSSLDNMSSSVTGLRCLGTEDDKVTTGFPCHSVQHLWDTFSDCASNSGVRTWSTGRRERTMNWSGSDYEQL